MTTINLYQNKAENEKRSSSQNMNNGFFFSLSILIITVIALVALKTYVPILEGKNEELGILINTENVKLTQMKSLNQIIDMQNRTAEIKKNLKIENGEVSRTEITFIIDKLGQSMNKGVAVSKLDYSGSKLVIELSAKNFNDASRQIFNFKESNYFSNVELLDISREEKDVSFKVEMKING